MSAEHIYQQAIAERREQNRLRTLRTIAITGSAEIVDGQNRTLLNFASNDYLALSKHARLKERAIEYIQKYGVGSGSSRLVSGNLEAFDKIERKIAQFKGTEAALILPSGYQTNSTVIAALGRKETLMLSDHQNHNSIAFGMQQTQGKWQRYRHNDFNHLRARLDESEKSAQKNQVWILSESVFSMDGDTTDIAALTKLGTEYGAATYIDEAHATGVLGPNGRGLCHTAGSVDVIMGTFSKAMGSAGAFIACSSIMRDYLINFCSGLIYSTALPPSVLGSIDAALDVIPTMEVERTKLLELSEYLRTNLNRLGYSTGNSCTQIIPIIVGDDSVALALAAHLEEHGILAPAIRPPTVQEGQARVRVSLTSDHSKQHVEQLISTVAKFCGARKKDSREIVGAGHNG